MFHLDALVNFEEVIIAIIIYNELDGAGIGVTCDFGNPDSGLADLVAQFTKFIFEQRRRRFFNQFLIATLNGAIAFPPDE